MTTTVAITVEDLKPGHVLADGGTVTSRPSMHPCGRTVVEVDWICLRNWPLGAIIEIHPPEDQR